MALSSSLENKYIQKLQNIQRPFKRDITDRERERERERVGGEGSKYIYREREREGWDKYTH